MSDRNVVDLPVINLSVAVREYVSEADSILGTPTFICEGAQGERRSLHAAIDPSDPIRRTLSSLPIWIKLSFVNRRSFRLSKSGAKAKR